MIKENIIIGTKYPLNGLLTLPETGTAPYPAVVLVHGSGPNDMDEKVGNTYSFRDLAEGLAKHGIATIRYHKRTFVYGKELVKDQKLDLSVKEESIEDAVFAADLLRKDQRINPEKIFIAGHSMGGMLAPRIDAEGGNFAGLIILAGSPRKMEELMTEQQNAYLKDANAIIKWIADKQIEKIRKKFAQIYDMTEEEAKTTPVLGKYIKAYYFREWGLKPSIDYLKNTSKPILVMHGSADVHVSVKNDFEKYKEILSNNPNVSFKLYPNLNHLFMPSIYGDIKKIMKEYKKPQKMEEYVISDIAAWVKK